MHEQVRQGDVGAVLAQVLLPRSVFPSGEGVAERLAARGGRHRLTWDEPKTLEHSTTQLFTVDGEHRIRIALLSVPALPDLLALACGGNPLWPEALAVCHGHQAHLLVATESDGGDPIDRHLMMTDLTAAIAETVAGVAIIWQLGATIQPRDRFSEMASSAKRNDLPLMLWIGFRFAQGDDGAVQIGTNGLKPFGVKEIEGASHHLKPMQMLEKVYDLAHYSLQGAVLRDGETVGASAAERIRIHHRPSAWNSAEQVIHLDFDGERAGGGWRGFLSGLLGGRK